MNTTRYEMACGLEVHAALATQSKMFCRCSTKFGDPPNTNICPVCLGLPGSLPVLNREAVVLGMRAALALDCSIHLSTHFDRKNYFYPDLPKGYQISQFYEPLATGGGVEIDSGKKVRVRRLHLEEDTGKSLHSGDNIETADYTLVDFNRSGVPLAEIVSEPDIASPEEARQYLEKMQRILLFARVSDVKIEEGSMRVDCNISVRPAGATELGVPVELKNLSSFRAVVKALAYEFSRQTSVLQKGQEVLRETRGWNEVRGVTFPMRMKDEGLDYRCFPEPDLARLEISKEMLQEVRRFMPDLPQEIERRLISSGLSLYDAQVLTASPNLVAYFDRCVALGADPKTASNWIMGDLLGLVNLHGLSLDKIPVSPENLVRMLDLIEDGVISGKIAKDVLAKMMETGKGPQDIVREEGLQQLSDESALEAVVDQVISANQPAVKDLLGGKGKALGFLVGQVMKATRGKANPAKVNAMLKSKIL